MVQPDLERKHPLAARRKAHEDPSPPRWLPAVQAARSRKAADVAVLDLRDVTSFTDHFVICTGGNPRQIQAIADEVAFQLKKAGARNLGTEGYSGAEWILLDYGDYIVHVFSEEAREYYDLDRLWRHAKKVELPEEE